MGREIRMVPPNWQHPKKDHYGEESLQPMYDRTYAEARQHWIDGFLAHKPEDHDGLDYWEYDEQPPDRAYHRSYSDEEAPWFQVWETVSEGTPVSPPFATKEELAQHLAVHGDDWDRQRGQGGWGIERARAFVEDEWAPSMMIANGVIYESKDVALAMKQDKESKSKGSE